MICWCFLGNTGISQDVARTNYVVKNIFKRFQRILISKDVFLQEMFSGMVPNDQCGNLTCQNHVNEGVGCFWLSRALFCAPAKCPARRLGSGAQAVLSKKPRCMFCSVIADGLLRPAHSFSWAVSCALLFQLYGYSKRSFNSDYRCL